MMYVHMQHTHYMLSSLHAVLTTCSPHYMLSSLHAVLTICYPTSGVECLRLLREYCRVIVCCAIIPLKLHTSADMYVHVLAVTLTWVCIFTQCRCKEVHEIKCATTYDPVALQLVYSVYHGLGALIRQGS